MAQLKTLNLQDEVQNRIQDNTKKAIDQINSNQLTSGTILKSVALKAGSNTINHKLGRTLTGWYIVRQRSAPTFAGTVAVNLSNSGTTPTLATSPYTVLPFNNVIYDTNSAWSTSTNEYTVPVSGVYSITLQPLYNSTSASVQINSYIVIKNASGVNTFDSITRSPIFTTGQFVSVPCFYQNYLPAGYKIVFGAWSSTTPVQFWNDPSYSKAFIQRLSGDPPNIYDTQDSNKTPAQTLLLTSSTDVTVDIYVF